MGEVIQMAAEPSSLAGHAWELMKFYGWKDKDGDLRTFKEWAKAAALACPYPAFFEDPEVQRRLRRRTTISICWWTSSRIVPIRSRPAMPSGIRSSRPSSGDAIQQMLKGEKTPTETAAALADKVVALKKEISG